MVPTEIYRKYIYFAGMHQADLDFFGQADYWWLRSPTEGYSWWGGACYVELNGSVNGNGYDDVNDSYGQATYWWLRSPVNDPDLDGYPHAWMVYDFGAVFYRDADSDVGWNSYGKYLEILYSKLFRSYTPS